MTFTISLCPPRALLRCCCRRRRRAAAVELGEGPDQDVPMTREVGRTVASQHLAAQGAELLQQAGVAKEVRLELAQNLGAGAPPQLERVPEARGGMARATSADVHVGVVVEFGVQLVAGGRDDERLGT